MYEVREAKGARNGVIEIKIDTSETYEPLCQSGVTADIAEFICRDLGYSVQNITKNLCIYL